MPLFLLVAAALVTAAPASPPPVLVKYAGIALDPAGKRIATIDSEQVKGEPVARHGILVIRDTRGQVIEHHDPCQACNYAGPAWSPDGRSLAYIASGNGTATLYVLADGQNRKVATIKGLAATARWSPDGRSIAFLATLDATKETGATQPGARQVGVIGDKEDSKRIAIVPAQGGAYRLVSPEGTFVYEYSWTPDGRGFVGTAAEGNGDNQWWVASLRGFRIDGAMRIIAAPKMQMNWPTVSPDGRTVAFIGGLMSDFPVPGGDIYTVDMNGGEPTDLTPAYRASFTSLLWNGPRLIAGVTRGGSTGVATIDPVTQKVTGQVEPEMVGARGELAVAPDRTGANAAYIVESFISAPRIAFGPLGKGSAISHDNDNVVSGVTARDIRWTSDERDVQGWLLSPAGAAQSGAKQPMITIVHGGPSSASTPRFPWGDEPDLFTGHGYWVFMPNPRGSYGQGEAFTRANIRDFGGGDLRDILAGIDAVEKQAPIDDKRLGLYGHSYGGFMAMWTVTDTNRFRAAVAGAGIANWISYYGQNGIDQWMIPFFGGSTYEDPKIYDKLSPIRYIKEAKTPTLLYVGERDVECPPAQSLEFWHGLKAMGVPTELVIYRDEGHGIRQPDHLRDREARMIGWFDRWLGAGRP